MDIAIQIDTGIRSQGWGRRLIYFYPDLENAIYELTKFCALFEPYKTNGNFQ